MSIATEITRLQTAKADIKTAIEAKGVTVPSSATLDTYDTYVSQISGGGGSETLLKSIIQKTATTLSAADITTAYGTGDTIPDMAFGMYDNNYDSVTTHTWPYNIPLTSITLPSNIKNIGYGAFWGANNLTTVDLSNCSNVTIGVDAFTNSAITSFTAPAGSALKGLVFYTCPNLTTVDLSNADGSTWSSTVTTYGYRLLRNCTALTEVTLPTNVAAIPKEIFSLCSSLRKVNFAGTVAEYTALPKGANYKQNAGAATVHCSDGTTSL